ncbi:MAG TPA: DUF302 domain-containing protein [Aliiroseovarius sp.]|nr:DUF302 domain-containing protein [Aliiroseovarius sp.]
MTALTRILALIGVLAIALAAWIGPDRWRYKAAFDTFDDHAFPTYKGMFDRLVETGNSAAATVWSVKVAEGLTFEEVDESIQAVAIDNNIKDVGALPLGDQVEAMTGEPWRKLKIYLYCNPLTAAKMVEHDIAYAAYLPCRVSLVEDANGDLWLTSLDMDMMIHGGKTLPPELLEEAMHVKGIIQDILNRASGGDF